MKSIVFLVLTIVAFIAAQQGTNNPNSIVLPVVVHDFFPCATNEWVSPPPGGRADKMIMDNCNPDIEPYQTSPTHWGSGLSTANKGMVAQTLDSNRKMVYIKGQAPGQTTSPTYQTQNSDSFNRRATSHRLNSLISPSIFFHSDHFSIHFLIDNTDGGTRTGPETSPFLTTLPSTWTETQVYTESTVTLFTP